MTLTKVNIVDAVAEQNGYSKHQSLELIEILLEIIKRTLESGDDVLVECVFADTDNIRLPVNGIVCGSCGPVQGVNKISCMYCGAGINTILH